MEGRLSTVCALILILGAIGCSDARVPKDKPGMCPRLALSTSSECVSTARHACKNDYNCRGKQKCCSSRCGLVCVDPLPVHDEVNPGVCPDFPVYSHSECLHSGHHKCKNDHHCRKGHKCCRTRCGNVCLPTLLSDGSVKPGECPRIASFRIPVCTLDALPECTKDNDCKGKQKCCHHLCGPVCTDPLPVKDKVKPGKCPRFPISSILKCVDHVQPECTKDDDCKGKQKCCRNACGLVCADPAPINRVKPGNCPRIRWLGSFWCRPETQDECTHDGDCPHNLKCCTQQCGRVCSPPYPDILPFQ